MSNSLASHKDQASSTCNELIISINPCNWDITEYQGTRAQLVAEGVIPEGSEWPDGDKSITWQAGPFEYDLCRKRPQGMKGPKKLWVEGDWWLLRWQPINRTSRAERDIKRKRNELNEALYRQSPKGIAEINATWDRYWATLEDAKFQTFKALIPGLVRTKRGGGRRRKNADPVHELNANV